MTLEEVKLRYVRYVLYMHNGNRTSSAKYLGISVRGMRNWINKMKEMELIEDEAEADLEFDFSFPFPSNEKRLRYLNNPRLKF